MNLIDGQTKFAWLFFGAWFWLVPNGSLYKVTAANIQVAAESMLILKMQLLQEIQPMSMIIL